MDIYGDGYPFRLLRGIHHLGGWASRQDRAPWYRVFRPPLVGPVLNASLSKGLCRRKTVYLSRQPLTGPSGRAAWAVLLAIIHPVSRLNDSHDRPLKRTESLGKAEQSIKIDNVAPDAESFANIAGGQWAKLDLRPLIKHKTTTCTEISRATFMALLCLTNARPVFRYSGSCGHRAAYASYCGQWRVEWPIGDVARVFFSKHDSHTQQDDVYPPLVERKVDTCLQMLAGVIDGSVKDGARCRYAFPGRKSAGEWVLEYTPRGFTGAHSGRHLYNMIGGDVNRVNLFRLKNLPTATPPGAVTVWLPNATNGNLDVTLLIPEPEARFLNETLDFLPWTFLPWSVHRGLRDILVAFAKRRMNQHRESLAKALRDAVAESRLQCQLVARGWKECFVKNDMAHIAASAVLADSGNSGDAVRIVTDIALVLWNNAEPSSDKSLHETYFWRCNDFRGDARGQDLGLDAMQVVALVKCFVLEWSNELDYQLYHELPMELYLG